jgi:hypothetical protein
MSNVENRKVEQGGNNLGLGFASIPLVFKWEVSWFNLRRGSILANFTLLQ